MWLLAALLWLAADQCIASRILVLVPSPSYSHTIPINKVVEGLLDRGHHVTHLSTDAAETKSKNYEWIDISATYTLLRGTNLSIWAESSSMELAEMYYDIGVNFCNVELNMPVVKEWLQRKDHQFDLVLMERLPYQCFYGVVHRVGSPPLVGIVTLPAKVPAYYAIGNPINPAYLPDVFIGYTDHMNFWQRLHNTYHALSFLYFWQTTVLPTHEAIMREHFGPEPPSVFETDRNFSAILLAVHFSGHYPRPNLPNVIELTGLHVSDKTKPLPADIKKFLDGANHGVIYFSLGSNVRSETLPDFRVRAFVDAFRQLPQRVIWKWGGDPIPDLPDNVMVRKWLPQPDILAHPNVKLFIMQGGLQSWNEASLRGIPLLAIPFFSDQRHNVAKIVSAGIGAKMLLREITKEKVIERVRTVLEDLSYRENMKRYSELFREHYKDAVPTAVWWLEYVIRHKGAPHLRSAALDLHWWQLLLLDVIAFVLLVIVTAVAALYFAVRRLVSAIFGNKHKVKKH